MDGLPNEAYGFGKIDAAALVLGGRGEAGAPPRLTLDLRTPSPRVGLPVRIRARVDDWDAGDREPALSRDIGYDGTYEAGPFTETDHTFTPEAPGILPVVAEVTDGSGNRVRALLRVEVGPPCEDDDCIRSHCVDRDECPGEPQDPPAPCDDEACLDPCEEGEDCSRAKGDEAGCSGCAAGGGANLAWLVAVLPLFARRRR